MSRQEWFRSTHSDSRHPQLGPASTGNGQGGFGRWGTGALAVLLAPLWAAEPAAATQDCGISPPAQELIAMGEATDGRVVGTSRGQMGPAGLVFESVRSRVYHSEPLGENDVELVIEKRSGRNEGRITVCEYSADQNWDSARHLGSYYIGRGADAGEYIQATYSDLQGRRLLIEILTLRRYAPRSFSYRISLDGLDAAGDDIAQHQHVFELDDQEAAASEPDLTSDPGPGPGDVAQDASDDQERLRTPAEVTARDERGRPAEPADDVSGPDGFLSAPGQVVVGSSFEASWTDTQHPRDLVVIVEAAAEEDARGASRHQRGNVGDGTSRTLIAPAQPGAHEVRYLSREDGLIASVPIEVVDAEISIEAPAQVTVGQSFEVTWGDPVHGRDRVVVVPAEADDSASGASRHQRRTVRERTSGSLTAPEEPGAYEIRYQLDQGRRVMGRAPVQVVDADVSLEAPAQVVAGESFEVAWGDPVHGRDRVVVVPAEADDSASGASRHQRRTVRERTSGSLTAPEEPGAYEIRYQLDQGRRVMGRASVEVVPEGTDMASDSVEPDAQEPEEPQLTHAAAPGGMRSDPTGRISVPRQVVVGTSVEIELHRVDSGSDFVLLVEAGSEADADRYTRMRYRVGDNEVVRRGAPGHPASMEVRYFLTEDRSLAASLPVEIVDADIEIAAPQRVQAGASFTVSLSDVLSTDDYLVIVDADRAADDIVGFVARNRNKLRDTRVYSRTAPRQPGTYEARYYLAAGHRLMASARVEVVAELEAHEIEAEAREEARDEDGRVAARDMGPADAETATGPAEAADPDTPRQWRDRAQDDADRGAAPDAADIRRLESRIGDLAARIERAQPSARDRARRDAAAEIAGLGARGQDVLLDMIAAGMVDRALGMQMMEAARAAGLAPDAGHAAPAPAPAPHAAGPAAAAPGTVHRQATPGMAVDEAQAERRIIALVAALGAAAPPDRDALIGELAHYGEPAVDILLELMQQGLIERAVALEAVAAVQSAAPAAAAPEPPPHSAPPSAEPRYRVVGVEWDDMLNVRDSAGVSGTIVGRLPPDATGIARSGREGRAADGGIWWEILDPGLSGGSGWVNARFLALAAQAAQPEPEGPTVGELAADFTEVGGYETLDSGQVVDALREALPADPASVFLPDSGIGPLAKAILLLEANEGVLPRVRYRLRYGMAQVPLDPAGRTLPMSFVEVSRFNLGPAIREEVARSTGGRAGPAEAFGVGPHVSYRFAMRPIQGQSADVVGAARAEIPDVFADGMSCLGLSCLSLELIGENTAEWSAMERIVLDFAPPYDAVRDGVLSPAAAIDLAARELGVAQVSGDRLVWSGFEARESVGPMEPFAEAVIDVNLGQDAGVDTVIQDDHVMDHAIQAVWQRIASVADDGAAPAIFGADAVEHRPGHN